MYRRIISYTKSTNLLPLIFTLIFTGCFFVDLRPITYNTEPKESYTILPDEYSTLSVSFNTPMLETETKNIMQILGASGLVEGELSWEENTLIFSPSSPWIPGLRYVLKLNGVIKAKDGREMIVFKELPFFAISRSIMPYLESFYPEDGSSTGVFGPDEIVLKFTFSEPMDRQSTETAFSFEGLGEKKFLWLEDDKVLHIQSLKQISPWIVCRWTISEKARSREGIPLAKEMTGRFITDNERDRPFVTRIIPLLKTTNTGPWGLWMQADIDLTNGLGAEQALGIEFNRAMETESLRRAFLFEPSLPGSLEHPDPSRTVYIPNRNVQPETIYKLNVSRDVRDIEGLRMGEDYSISFVSDIPYLNVLSLTPNGGGNHINPKNYDVIKASLIEGDGGVFRFTLRFSLPLTEEEQIESVFRISLQSFFPSVIKPVSLRFTRWLSSDMLRMEWEGLEPGSMETPHYYRLLLPGGRNGISTGNGSYFKEDLIYYIEAVEL